MDNFLGKYLHDMQASIQKSLPTLKKEIDEILQNIG